MNAPRGQELPADIHRRIAIYLGEGEADDIVKDVRAGEMTLAEADEWSKGVEESWERSRGRPDIEPENWQVFEEGWRPEGWWPSFALADAY